MIKLGVTAIILSSWAGQDNSSIILVKRKSGSWKGYWSLPGGGVKQGESLRKALEREVREETGFRIRASTAICLPVIEVIKGSTHKVIACMSGTIIGGELRAGSDAAVASKFPLGQYGKRVSTMKLTPITRKLLRIAGRIEWNRHTSHE